jgi:hypothetical protein
MTPRERAIFVQGFCFATSRIVTREDMLGLCAKMLLAWGISMAEGRGAYQRNCGGVAHR